MKNIKKPVIIGIMAIELILLFVDCNKEIALHRIVKYVETGVISQDLLYKFASLWVRILSLYIKDVYLIINKIVLISFAAIMLISIVGIIIKKSIITKIGSILNVCFFIIPLIVSRIRVEHYTDTVVIYRFSLYGYLLVLLSLICLVLSMCSGKPLKVSLKRKNNKNYIEEINGLAELYNSGAITKEEYEAKKKELLNL